MDFLLMAGGLVILLLAGDALVKGAVALSLRAGLPAMVVSATVVAFGTSAPELLISVQAALEGAPGIALGNVVGSNIANVWLVLGVPALIAPIAGCREGNRAMWYMLVATAVFIALVLPGTIAWWGGLALFAIVLVMVGDSLRDGLRRGEAAANPAELEELGDVDPSMPKAKIAGFLVAGLIGLPLGAQLLIDGARGIALEFGVSEAVIGVTIVAVGTSLPELATTIVAALRGQADVALGNVLGSNVFNLTAIIGIAAMVAPLEVPDEILTRDVWVMLAATLTLVPFVILCMRIGRRAGTAFLALYAAFIAVTVASAV